MIGFIFLPHSVRKSYFLLLLSVASGHFYSIGYQEYSNEPISSSNLKLKSANIEIEEQKQNGNVTSWTGTMQYPKKILRHKIQISCFNCRENLSPGDLINVENLALQKIKPSTFQWRLDFNSLLIDKGIFYKGWVSDDQLSNIGHENNLKSFLSKIRTQVHSSLREECKNHAVVMAICMGDKTAMAKDSKNLFISNGIAHIMAVSGLHIGIVYLVIFSILRWIKWDKKLVGLVFALLIVWIFILLTGAPVSALRSGIMITIYTVFLVLERKNEKLHILIFSAWILLLWDPYQLFAVGFQLSFGALSGILYFGDFFTQKLQTRFKGLKYFTDIIGISLAVQITTLPLSIYYFHAFPLHFVVTNLIAIPFAFLVLVLFIIAMFFGILPIVQKIFFLILDQLIDWTLSFLHYFEQFESLFLKGLYLSLGSLIVYYLGLIILFGWKHKYNSNGIKIIVLATCTWNAQCFSMIWGKNDEQLLLYEEKGICLLVKNGDRSTLISTNKNVNTTYFHPLIQNHLKLIHVNETISIQIGNKRIYLNPKSTPETSEEQVIIVYSKLELAQSKIHQRGMKIFTTQKVQNKLKSNKFISIEDFVPL
ncbi:MAG: ComEC/Rec2 family competence protein [Crocinitomicaceae bacterium]